MKDDNSEYVIATHNGVFHADDVFAVATLSLLFEKKEGHVLGDLRPVRIVRTRDLAVWNTADFVVDVGLVYDPAKGRFDHHQAGGAGERANTIPYASFGLVWKTFGEKLAGSKEAADAIDQRLVQPIDALDNGVSITKEIFPGVRPFDISAIIGGMNASWNEGDNANDSKFLIAVQLAKDILNREITGAKFEIASRHVVEEIYESTADKRLIVLDQEYPWEGVLSKYSEPLFVVYPKDGNWRMKTVRSNPSSFESRKYLPESWAGKSGVELSAVTGVPGGIFCHNKRFMAAAETKEAILGMAEIALNS